MSTCLATALVHEREARGSSCEYGQQASWTRTPSPAACAWAAFPAGKPLVQNQIVCALVAGGCRRSRRRVERAPKGPAGNEGGINPGEAAHADDKYIRFTLPHRTVTHHTSQSFSSNLTVSPHVPYHTFSTFGITPPDDLEAILAAQEDEDEDDWLSDDSEDGGARRRAKAKKKGKKKDEPKEPESAMELFLR